VDYNELIKVARDASGIQPDLLKKYKDFLYTAAGYGEGNDGKNLDEVLSDFKIKNFSQGDLLKLSKLAAIEQMVLNACSRFELSKNTPKPKERFKAVLHEMLDGKSDEEKEKVIKRIEETKNKMIISIVHTMHPVVFHTPESKKFESQITHALEESKECSGFISEFTKSAMSGKVTITPLKKISTETENEMEKDNYANIIPYYEDVPAEWNEAIGELSLPNRLKISNYKDIFESRTWGNGADADDREKSTAVQLYNYLHDNANIKGDVIDGFNAPIPDLRQNAKVHKDLVSALVGSSISNTSEINKLLLNPKGLLITDDLKSDDYSNLKTILEDNSSLSEEGQAVCVEVVKRLFVMADAIESGIIKPQKKDDKDFYPIRHQIANFSGASNFYEMLLLFSETGLVEIENNAVKKVKMGIQPLLETEEDLKAAPGIFKKLLGDPLVLSYYRERGVAEIMVGFSDGAKSAGNFASQFAIYKATKELSKLFAENGIPLRVFEGRGRGPDRGGTIEAGIASHLMPAEVARQCTADRTFQGDLPIDMSNSAFYGKDQLTSIMIGIIQAAENANTLTDGDIKRIESYEKAAETIAKTSSAIFNELVANNDDAFTFIKSMPTNPNKSSRKAARDQTNTVQSYANRRAVPVEEAANLADFPFHNIGLAEALEEFKNGEITVMTKDGKKVSGKAALKEMAENWPFFREFFRVDYLGMNHFDANIAEKYAKMAKVEKSDFVIKGIQSLNSLKTALNDLVPDADKQDLVAHKKSPLQKGLEALDKFGHTVLFSPIFEGGFSGYQEGRNLLLDEIKNLAMKICYNEVTHKAKGLALSISGYLEKFSNELNLQPEVSRGV